MNEEILRAGEWLRKHAVPIVTCVLLTGAGLYILFQYGARLKGAGPYLFLLACPLMHLFMHRRHGGHGGHGSSSEKDTVQRNEHHHH